MKTYRVNSLFLTLQGEGTRAGAKSLFCRFAGCNLWDGLPEHRALGKGACARWCDTDFAKGEPLTAPQLLARMEALWPARLGEAQRWCVLTGGEPLLQLDAELVRALAGAGWRLAVETNGTVEPGSLVREHLALVTCSPKRGGALTLVDADELKVVLPGDAAQPWLEGELQEMAKQLGAKALFVQPQDAVPDAYAKHLQQCIAFAQAHPDWRVGMQLHKLWQLP